MSVKKIPTTEDVLAFVPKGRSISPKEWRNSMEMEGYDVRLCQMIMQRLLDPDDLYLVDLDRDMKFILRQTYPRST